MSKKKRNSIRSFLWVLVLLIAGVIVVNIWIVRPNVYYPGFEIFLPTGYEIHGIDVSRYQQKIDWEEVGLMESKGVKIGFVFVKATEGNNLVDRQFNRNWKELKKNNIPRGAYHFFVPGKPADRQAKNFIRSVRLEPSDLPPVIDIETSGRLSKNELRRAVQDWLNQVEDHYRVTPIIYTNVTFYEDYFSRGFEKYPVWVAHYLHAKKPRTMRKWSFWQHNEQGRVNGIKGLVDFNVFNGDSADFRSLLVR